MSGNFRNKDRDSDPNDPFGFLYEQDNPGVGPVYADDSSIAGIQAGGDINIGGRRPRDRDSRRQRPSRFDDESSFGPQDELGGGFGDRFGDVPTDHVRGGGAPRASKPTKVKPPKQRKIKVRGKRRRFRVLKIVLLLAIIGLVVGYVKVPAFKQYANGLIGNAAGANAEAKDGESGAQTVPNKPAPAAGGKCAVPSDAVNRKKQQVAVAGAAKASAEAAILTKAAPSAVIVVGCRDKAIATATVGQIGGAAPSVQDTLYDLASVTKSFVAVSILKLADSGKLKLDDPVGKYLPEWKSGDKAKVTVRMLLQHRSGLPAEGEKGASYSDIIAGSSDPLEIEQRILEWPLTSEPNAASRYSNLGYVVLYRLGNVAAGQQLNRYMRSSLFDPLGMEQTWYKPNTSKQCAPTHPYEQPGQTLQCVARDLLARETGGVTGHAGLFTTAADLSKFAAMLANGGVYGGKRYISAANVALMGKVQPAPSSYGLGAWTNSKKRWGSQMSAGAFGGYGDTGVSFSVDPATGYWVVNLNNSSPTDNPTGVVREAAIKKAIQQVNNAVIAAAKKAS